MPCWPVFMGPLPVAFLAMSSFAFLSTGHSNISRCQLKAPREAYLTGLLLGFEGLVLFVFLALGRFLGFFVVDRVRAGWVEVSA